MWRGILNGVCVVVLPPFTLRPNQLFLVSPLYPAMRILTVWQERGRRLCSRASPISRCSHNFVILCCENPTTWSSKTSNQLRQHAICRHVYSLCIFTTFARYAAVAHIDSHCLNVEFWCGRNIFHKISVVLFALFGRSVFLKSDNRILLSPLASCLFSW